MRARMTRRSFVQSLQALVPNVLTQDRASLPEDFDFDSDIGSDFVWFYTWEDKRHK